MKPYLSLIKEGETEDNRLVKKSGRHEMNRLWETMGLSRGIFSFFAKSEDTSFSVSKGNAVWHGGSIVQRQLSDFGFIYTYFITVLC